MSDINDAIQLADKWGGAISEAIGKYGPDAYRLAETVARVECAKQVVTPAIILLVCFVVVRKLVGVISRHVQNVKEKEGAQFEFFDCEPGVVVPAGAAAFFVGLVGTINFGFVLNLTAWAGLYEPKIWIVSKLLKL